jgi:hypothetical protein
MRHENSRAGIIAGGIAAVIAGLCPLAPLAALGALRWKAPQPVAKWTGVRPDGIEPAREIARLLSARAQPVYETRYGKDTTPAAEAAAKAMHAPPTAAQRP